VQDKPQSKVLGEKKRFHLPSETTSKNRQINNFFISTEYSNIGRADITPFQRLYFLSLQPKGDSLPKSRKERL
jgi:hypothetical protein